MRSVANLLLTAGVAVGAVSSMAVNTPPIDVQTREVQLTNGDTADSPLGDGTALIIGPSVLSTPSQTYADFANTLYLEPAALPEIDYNYFTSELAAGNLMDSIGVPIAADLGIIPLALLGAAIPIPL